MIISEVIKMLEEEKAKHGDIAVYVDMDYGQRTVERDDEPLCPCPQYQAESENNPERIVI